jgi:hypothetical protein
MRDLGRFLRLAIVALLVARTFAVAPVAAWAFTNGTAAADCTCTLGDEAHCPMHHKPAPSRGTCAMRGLADSSTDLLASMFGFVGVMPTGAESAAPAPSGRPMLVARALSTDRPTPPEPPPPRL